MAFQLSEKPFFQPSDSFIGYLSAGDDFQCVGGTLRSGRKGIVKRDVMIAEPLAGNFRLLSAEIRQRRIASALDFMRNIEHRLTVTHQIQCFHDYMLLYISDFSISDLKRMNN